MRGHDDGGLGRKAVPFHRSASGARPAELSSYPPARQLVTVLHETPYRLPSVAPAGSGTAPAVHPVPFRE